MHGNGVNAEMRENFGYAMPLSHGVTASKDDPGHKLYTDLLNIFRTLHVVTNSGPPL